MTLEQLHDSLMNTWVEEHTIEFKYSVQPGEDWLAVRMASPFKVGQRVTFSQLGATERHGTVIDIRRTAFDRKYDQYGLLVQYDGQRIPRWTLSKWLLAGVQ